MCGSSPCRFHSSFLYVAYTSSRAIELLSSRALIRTRILICFGGCRNKASFILNTLYIQDKDAFGHVKNLHFKMQYSHTHANRHAERHRRAVYSSFSRVAKTIKIAMHINCIGNDQRDTSLSLPLLYWRDCRRSAKNRISITFNFHDHTQDFRYFVIE